MVAGSIYKFEFRKEVVPRPYLICTLHLVTPFHLGTVGVGLSYAKPLYLLVIDCIDYNEVGLIIRW